MNISSNIALISVIASLVTALVAVVGSVLSAIITSKNSKRTKQLELFFHAKVEAYSDLLAAIANSNMYDYSSLQALFAACSKARLFAGKETSIKIKHYGDTWITAYSHAQQNGTNTLAPDEIRYIDAAFDEFLPAQNKELSNYS